MKKLLLATVALGLAGIVYAIAQTVPTVSSLSNADLVQVIPNAAPRVGNQYATMATVKTFANSGGTSGAITATTVTADAIAAGDASLGITGLAAAQGGAIAAVGGTSSTAGNAGGAITATGGTPGSTGVGGAVTLTAGAGGSASGNGGVGSLKGGAGTAGNGVGGAASVTGGAGNGSGAGGAASLVGGAAGATGVGGQALVTAGAPTAGAGSNVVITASAGAGSTNTGGSVNLVPGAAVSTGIPGKVLVNNDANLMCGSYYFTGTPAATNQVFYIANRVMIVTSISEVHSVAAGGTSTLDVTKDTSTNAPAAGTALGQAAFNLASTANTVQNATLNATIATITLAAGDRLAVKFNHAIQSSAGVVVTACMAPL